MTWLCFLKRLRIQNNSVDVVQRKVRSQGLPLRFVGNTGLATLKSWSDTGHTVLKTAGETEGRTAHPEWKEHKGIPNRWSGPTFLRGGFRAFSNTSSMSSTIMTWRPVNPNSAHCTGAGISCPDNIERMSRGQDAQRPSLQWWQTPKPREAGAWGFSFPPTQEGNSTGSPTSQHSPQATKAFVWDSGCQTFRSHP